MARHVIEDSDGEGSDLSPIKSPVAPVLDQGAPGTSVCQSDASPAPSRSGSTDPSFFQRIYDEHNQTGSIDLLDQHQTNEEPSLECALAIDAPQRARYSPTDPTMANVAHSKTVHGANTKQGSACAQMTTPGKPARDSDREVDIWDIPSSPVANGPERGSTRKTTSASVSKVYGKRRRTSQQSSEVDATGYAAIDPLPPATPITKRVSHGDQTFSIGATTMNSLAMVNVSTTMNKVRSTTMSALTKAKEASRKYGSHQIHESSAEGPYADSVHLITVPVSEDPDRPGPLNVKNTRDQSSGLVTETQLAYTQKDTRIEVNLSHALSSSERQAYRVYNLSGDSDTAEVMDDSSSLALPTLAKSGQDPSRSSAAATVAMATPSAYAHSPVRRGAESSDLPSTEIPMPPPSTASSRVRKRKSAAIPTSSPDIISGTLTRSAKRRKFAGAGDDALGALFEATGHSPSTPRSAQLRSSALESLPDTQPPPGGFQLPQLQKDSTVAGNLAEIAAKEERFSGRETGQGADAILISSSQEATPAEPLVQERLGKPKKRGRKKKDVLEPFDVSSGLITMEGLKPEPEEDINRDATLIPNETRTQLLQPTETPKKKPKRKRGRPKKATAKLGNASTNTSVNTSPNGLAEAQKLAITGAGLLSEASYTNTKAGNDSNERQKRESTESFDAIRHVSTGDGSPRRKGENRGKSVVVGTTEQESIKSNETKKDDKNDEELAKPVASAQPNKTDVASYGRIGSRVGKVSYRVGLSKRSRIAPLLKSLRK